MSGLKHICENCYNYNILHHDYGCIVTGTYTKPTDKCNCISFKSRLQAEKEDEEAYREHMERDWVHTNISLGSTDVHFAVKAYIDSKRRSHIVQKGFCCNKYVTIYTDEIIKRRQYNEYVLGSSEPGYVKKFPYISMGSVAKNQSILQNCWKPSQ